MSSPVVLGLIRPSRPDPLTGAAEARVLRDELARRIGECVLDLRVDALPVGPWRALEHAAWPRDVAVVIDPDLLYSGGLPPLTALFARTVEADAADVRRRMLRHLGVIPGAEFVLDGAMLAELGGMQLTPTDLWLVARAAVDVEVDDPAIVAFQASTGDEAQAALDGAFDAVVDSLAPHIDAPATVTRLGAERDALRTELTRLDDQLMRERSDAAGLVDDLRAQIGVLRDRLDRATDAPRT